MTESEKLIGEFAAACVQNNKTTKQVAADLYNLNSEKVTVRKPSFINQTLGLFKLSYDVGLIMKNYTKENKHQKNKDHE